MKINACTNLHVIAAAGSRYIHRECTGFALPCCHTRLIIMSVFTILYSDTCELLFNSGCAIEEGLHKKHPDLSEETLQQICEEIRKRILPNFNKKLREVKHSRENFWRKNSEWVKRKLSELLLFKLLLYLVL